jgi:hypothetical protein
MRGQAPTPRLDYSVRPTTVPYSADEHRRSIVALTITALNDTAEPVECPRLRILIPSAPDPLDTALTTDPTTITVDVGEATPWASFTSGDGMCHSVPLPPATGLPPGASAEFVIANIVVNTVPGTVDIDIYQAGDPVPIVRKVTKESPTDDVGAAPRIERFDVAPAQVALGGEVDVAWEVTGAHACTLAPGPVTLPSPAAGTVRLPVIHTGDFTLRALGAGGSASRTHTVTVMPAEIAEFASVPPGPVAPGQPVTLRWRTRFASSCSIDQDVGPVAAVGETTVTVARTTVYTLVAAGLDQQQRSLTLEVHA